MPQVNRSTSLINAQAGVAAPWGDASIAGNLQATLKAELRHGVAVDLGLGAFANVDAELSKFFSVEVAGEAHAEIRLTGQAQIPLNLFEEIGFAIRLKAAAEAAAGVSLRVGVNVGDFLDLIEDDLGLKGLPPRLALIFLEEATFGGGVYAKAAASAMAYANLVVACRAVPGPTPQEKPGFSILAEMGAGLKAGAGFRVFFDAPIDNFSRLVQRTVDAVVDDVAASIRDAVPLAPSEEDVLVDLFRIVAKVSFRVAYEAGVLLGTPPGVPQGVQGGAKLALRCTQVIQEEMQRVVLDATVRGALVEVERQLEAAVAGATQQATDAASSALEALADKLDAMPDEPLSLDAEPYWTDLFATAADAMQRLNPGVAVPGGIVAPMATAWSALALVRHALRRLNDPVARASFSMNALTLGTVENPFSGPMPTQPPDPIARYIVSRVPGAASGSPLTLDDLVQFLATEGLALAAQHARTVSRTIDLFRQASGSTAAQAAVAFLSKVGPIVHNAAGSPDEQATFRALLDVLRSVLENELRARLFTIARDALRESPELTVYFDEAIVPSIDATFTLLVDRVSQWATTPVDATAFKELASAIVLGVLGRSLVIFSDALLTMATTQLQEAFEDAADNVVSSGLRDALVPVAGATAAEDVVELAQDALRVAAEVFGPIPDSSRRRIRQAMFRIVAPLPPSAQAQFSEQIADALFIPNQDALDALRNELATIAGERFLLFTQKILLRVLDRFLEFVEDVIRAVQQLVVAFARTLDRLVQDLIGLVNGLLGEIAALGHSVELAIGAAGAKYDAFFAALAGSDSRGQLAEAVAKALVDVALDVLRDNPVYKALPTDVRTGARATMRGLIRGAIDQGWIGDIADGLLDAKGSLDDFVAEVRALDPSDGLASGIATILLDRIEDAVKDALPVDGISVPVAFQVAWEVDVPYFDVGSGRWRTAHYEYRRTVALGRVEIGLSGAWTALRNTIEAMQWFETLVGQIAGEVQDLLAKEHRLSQKRGEIATKQIEQSQASDHLWDESLPLTNARVAAPAAGSLVRSDTVLEIVLDAAPPSWLGLGSNEQQRVLVWLNDELLDLHQFEVHEQPEGTAPRLHFVPGSLVGAWGNRVALPPDQAALVTAPSARAMRRRTHAPATIGGFELVQTRGGLPDGASRLLQGPGHLPPRLGRLPLGALRPPPGALTLRRPLPVSDLRDGINTVLVVVVDAADQRRTAKHAFFASMPLTTKPEDREPKLPAGIRKVTGVPMPSTSRALMTPKRDRRASARKAACEVRAKMGSKLVAGTTHQDEEPS